MFVSPDPNSVSLGHLVSETRVLQIVGSTENKCLRCQMQDLSPENARSLSLSAPRLWALVQVSALPDPRSVARETVVSETVLTEIVGSAEHKCLCRQIQNRLPETIEVSEIAGTQIVCSRGNRFFACVARSQIGCLRSHGL